MTPEQKADFDRQGRTSVLDILNLPALPDETRKAAREWLSLNDAQRDRRDMWTLIAAVAAAVAAIAAAIIAAIK